jgi:TolA-binding protein
MRRTEGVALARAGRSGPAIRALRSFLSTYPQSARAGEAAARLGWLLVDDGDLTRAERWFRAAADDPVPSVRNSARAGLERVTAPAR